jgi:hypothetical protein
MHDDRAPEVSMTGGEQRPAVSTRSHILVALAAGIAAGVIYAVIWSISDRGSAGRLLLTALITFVVALLLRLFFVWYFTRRRR